MYFFVCLSWKLPTLNCNNHNSNYDYYFASFQRSKLACGLKYCFRYSNHLTNLDMNYLIESILKEKNIYQRILFLLHFSKIWINFLIEVFCNFWQVNYSVPAMFCLLFASAYRNFEPTLLSLTELLKLKSPLLKITSFLWPKGLYVFVKTKRFLIQTYLFSKLHMYNV